MNCKEKKMVVSFTFDDGTKDHYLIAAKILEKYDYRGLFNIIPSVIGTGMYMSWDDVRDLIDRGHEIGSHGMEVHNGIGTDNLHMKWRRGETQTVFSQVAQSVEMIERETGTRIKYFCFPHNAANPGLLCAIRKMGLIPVRCSRPNFGAEGERWTLTSPGDWIDEKIRHKEKYGALMFHGIIKKYEGFAAFDDDGTGFERCVKEVKDRDGVTIVVKKYSEIDWPVYDCNQLLLRIKGKIKRIFGL